MCYPKPGPRCSASAAAKVATARKACFVYLKEKSRATDKSNYNDFESLMKIVKQAQAEYEITPAGIKELERSVAQYPDSKSNINKLAEAKTLRAARISAAKAKNKDKEIVDSSHKIKFNNSINNYSIKNLSQNSDTLHAIEVDSPDIDLMIKEGEAFSHKLDANEIETLQWYTREGYADVNGSLSNPDSKEYSYDKEKAKEAVHYLDSAFAKVAAAREFIVYRRHFLYEEDGKFDTKTLKEKQELFAVGSTYKPNFFMSTSLNPDNAPPNDDGFVVFMEIKAKRAACLATIANSGTQEQEFLLPRDAKYKVVGNSNKITVKEQEGRTLTVIQLEEI
jgi:hypothetical protein